MLAAGLLLFSLNVFTVHGNVLEATTFDYITDAPDLDDTDWVYEFLDDQSVCDSNPCLNGGSCQTKSATEFTCLCVEPYTGKMCQRVRNVCKGVRCGFGDCIINLQRAPFYECKCKPPFQGSECRSFSPSPCVSNPCQNGGSCVSENHGFHCACPDGYTGKFCQSDANDCYTGNGESYRGSVSVTEFDEECLDWNSDSLFKSGTPPLEIYIDFDGNEQNHCRNPDGEEKPWCFIKRNGKLEWEYCKIGKCSGETRSPHFSQCGLSQPIRTSRIYGGRKSFPGAHPWQVSVQNRRKGSPYAFRPDCGGILIASCWVLTAAHCIFPTSEYQVVLGGVNIRKEEEMDQTIPVVEIIVHERYRMINNVPYNDVALLKLRVTDAPYCAKETRFVRSACLPDQMFYAGKECVISGWGATETASESSQLLNARVLLISQARCTRPDIYGSILDDTMFCAGTLQGGIDSCQGDSGGPLVCERNGRHYVSGIVSWGKGCGVRNKPGVYTNVFYFRDWITSKIN